MIPSGNQTWQWKNTNVPSFKPPSIRDCPLFVARVPHQKYIAITQRIYIYNKHEWRAKLLTNRNGHSQSGWFPIGCEGLYFHGMSCIKIGYR